MKIRPVRATRMDRHTTKLIVVFRNFAKAPKIQHFFNKYYLRVLTGCDFQNKQRFLSLWTVHRLGFVLQAVSVYCTESTESLNVRSAKFVIGQQFQVTVSHCTGPGFDTGPVHVRFVVDRVTLWKVRYFFEYLSFSLSISLRQRLLLIFTFILYLYERQADET